MQFQEEKGKGYWWEADLLGEARGGWSEETGSAACSHWLFFMPANSRAFCPVYTAGKTKKLWGYWIWQLMGVVGIRSSLLEGIWPTKSAIFSSIHGEPESAIGSRAHRLTHKPQHLNIPFGLSLWFSEVALGVLHWADISTRRLEYGWTEAL